MRGLFLICAVLLMIPCPIRAEDVVSPPVKRINPHIGKGNCEVCHVAPERDLESWFTFGSTKRKLHKDLNAICRQCHGVEFGHGVGKQAKMNLKDLPMDADGNIACAITCHNVHVQNGDTAQMRFHLRLPKESLCLSCHNK